MQSLDIKGKNVSSDSVSVRSHMNLKQSIFILHLSLPCHPTPWQRSGCEWGRKASSGLSHLEKNQGGLEREHGPGHPLWLFLEIFGKETLPRTVLNNVCPRMTTQAHLPWNNTFLGSAADCCTNLVAPTIYSRYMFGGVRDTRNPWHISPEALYLLFPLPKLTNVEADYDYSTMYKPWGEMTLTF